MLEVKILNYKYKSQNMIKSKFFKKSSEIIFFILIFISVSKDSYSFSPFEFDKNKVVSRQIHSVAASDTKTTDTYISTQFCALSIYLKFYRNLISPVRNNICPSYPSCSTYSFQAIKKFGALKGIILTADRLLHEADERKLKNFITIDGIRKINDPLENNLIFFDKSDKIK